MRQASQVLEQDALGQSAPSRTKVVMLQMLCRRLFALDSCTACWAAPSTRRWLINRAFVNRPLLHAARAEQPLMRVWQWRTSSSVTLEAPLKRSAVTGPKLGLCSVTQPPKAFQASCTCWAWAAVTRTGRAWQSYYTAAPCKRPGPLPKMQADLAGLEHLLPLAEGPQLRIRGHLHLLRLAEQLSDFVKPLGHDLRAQCVLHSISSC